MECHDQSMPVLAVHFFFKSDLVPLEVPMFTFVTIINGDWWQLQYFFEFLL